MRAITTFSYGSCPFNCPVDARGRGFVPLNLAGSDRNKFRFPSLLILDSQLLTLKNDAHPVE